MLSIIFAAAMKLSVVIPAYNEERTIHLILEKVVAVQLIRDVEKEIILVDDRSTDDTQGAIESFISEHPETEIKYFKQPTNQAMEQSSNRPTRKAGNQATPQSSNPSTKQASNRAIEQSSNRAITHSSK